MVERLMMLQYDLLLVGVFLEICCLGSDLWVSTQHQKLSRCSNAHLPSALRERGKTQQTAHQTHPPARPLPSR